MLQKMNSILNVKILPDTHDCVVFCTDGEPDDLVAAKNLADKLGHLPWLFVVGEGKKPKLRQAKNWCRMLALSDVVCVQSRLSDREYPEAMLHVFDQPTSLSESAMSNLKDDDDDDVDERVCIAMLNKFLQSHKNPLIVMIKPGWELFDVDKTLLSKSTLAAYGSFNFRCLLDKFSRTDLADFLNTAFKRVVLYETFFVMGEDNSINNVNAPRLYELIRQKAQAGDAYWLAVQKAIAIWNSHIAVSQLRSLQKVSKAMYDSWEEEDKQLEAIATASGGGTDADQVWKKRRANSDKMFLGGAKIVNSIVVAKGQQMVFADFGLTTLMRAEAAELTPPETIVQCTIEFDEGRGNTVFKPDAEGKVIVLKSVDKANLIKAVENSIQ